MNRGRQVVLSGGNRRRASGAIARSAIRSAPPLRLRRSRAGEPTHGAPDMPLLTPKGTGLIGTRRPMAWSDPPMSPMPDAIDYSDGADGPSCSKAGAADDGAGEPDQWCGEVAPAVIGRTTNSGSPAAPGAPASLVALASTSSPVALGEASGGIAGPAIRPGLAPPAPIEIRAPRQRVVHLGSGVCVVPYSIAQHSKLLAERRHYSHCACLALASACAQGKRRQHGMP